MIERTHPNSAVTPRALSLPRALRVAVVAARAAGQLMRRHQLAPKRVQSETQHDIKLELDVRCQKTIATTLLGAFPDHALLGEEGTSGDPNAPWRWVVDPIDGTVNFAHGVPHACVSIALQRRNDKSTGARQAARNRAISTPLDPFQTVLGVVLDPFTGELWTAIRGGPARLNGRRVRVSDRPLAQAMVSIGFAKSRRSLEHMLSTFEHLVHRVRKVRIMGSAALALTYVASGRMDAFIEFGLRLWDVAAGGLIVECAGGWFESHPLPGPYTYEINANNGRLGKAVIPPDRGRTRA